MQNKVALVIGGYLNGYSIIRELYDQGVTDIWLVYYGNSFAHKSNKIKGSIKVEKNAESLKKALFKLKEQYDYIIPFPTDDAQLEFLEEIQETIRDFCFMPFNERELTKQLNKFYQYECCEKWGIPFPKTISVDKVKDIEKLNNFTFPIIIKPNKRDDLTTNVFRSLYLETKDELEPELSTLTNYLKNGVCFIASEFIPGDDTNIYSYTGYRNKKGEILNEWIGKKLNQYPDIFGVFSSATNQAPEIIRDQGRVLLNGIDLMGIAQPEFKYDSRDGTYKLMEINLRSMMWHRTGNLSGSYLQYTQWLDANKNEVIRYSQMQSSSIHFLYMKHEVINLIFRKSYWKYFKYNVFKGGKTHFGVFNFSDPLPFFYDSIDTLKLIVSKCLKVLKIR